MILGFLGVGAMAYRKKSALRRAIFLNYVDATRIPISFDAKSRSIASKPRVGETNIFQ
jgi:hypothetical protein